MQDQTTLLVSSAPNTASTLDAPSQVVEERRQRDKITISDNVLDETCRAKIFQFLSSGHWYFGWKSNPQRDHLSFWHRHFAGHRKEGQEAPYDCAAELRENAPLLFDFWSALESAGLKGHTLVRCYANGLPYGCDGTIHTDSFSDHTYTSVYYPHDQWHPNWGGETVFFNKDVSDVLTAIYPKPNRLLTFSGRLPHVARGVARTCPQLRITLMFKTEFKNG